MEAEVECDLAGRADQLESVEIWIARTERTDEYRMARWVVIALLSKWRAGTEQTLFRLYGWYERIFGYQMDDGGAPRHCTNYRMQ